MNKVCCYEFSTYQTSSSSLSSVLFVVFPLHPMLASSCSSSRLRSEPMPPYTNETTPTSEHSTVPLSKTSVKSESGNKRLLLEPAAGGCPSKSAVGVEDDND